MADAPIVAVGVVRVRAYNVIATAIEHACEAGVHRAYKYADAPDRDTIAHECARAVTDALAEILDFGDDT